MKRPNREELICYGKAIPDIDVKDGVTEYLK
jgi:hypothetical protein